MSKAAETEDPPGVVMVLVNADGREVASAAYFGRNCPGGFRLLEAQKHYCRERLATETVARLCAFDVRDVMGSYDAEALVRKLCDQKKYQLHTIIVGHPDTNERD